MHFEEVVIYSNKVEEVAGFYKNMEAEIEVRGNSYRIQTGRSTLMIKPSEKPWTYHLAFNIPYDQINEAKTWISQFAEIQEFQGKEIVNFPKWGAKALYFYDPAGNILEFIGRKPLKEKGLGEFSFGSIINISEVGWPVIDVAEAERRMQLPLYSRFGPAFSALGDAEALFIVVDANVKKWMPNDDKIQFSPCSVQVKKDGSQLQFERKEGVETFHVTSK